MINDYYCALELNPDTDPGFGPKNTPHPDGSGSVILPAGIHLLYWYLLPQVFITNIRI